MKKTDNICHLQYSILTHKVGQESVDLPREGDKYCIHYKGNKGAGYIKDPVCSTKITKIKQVYRCVGNVVEHTMRLGQA